ncbi:MAG: glycosyltransferase family 9 protein [Acidobacteria bacterium]|nr:MAG: glycosyltransferase family 9 protein [Acidobacteriota bacterium]
MESQDRFKRMLVPFDVEKIAVLRANGIGDLMFALPALAALRKSYPNAEIVLLAKRWHAEFFKDRPGPVDRVIPIPTYPGVGALEHLSDDRPDLDEFFAAMVRERFDLALQMHGGGRYSNPFVRRLGARLTAGLRSPDAVALDRWIPYVYFQPEIIRYLETVSLVGATPLGLEPKVEVTDRDVAESEAAVPPDGRPIVVLHPGATDGRRRWSPARFGAIGSALAEQGFRVVVSGSCEEDHVIQGVLQNMGFPGEGMSRLSLGGLAGLLSRAKLVVSNDSGPLHLAHAVGAATVGIYWCGNVVTAGPITRMRHRPAISWRLNCPSCGRNMIEDNCDHHDSFVDDVSVAEVRDHCLDLLRGALDTVLAD